MRMLLKILFLGTEKNFFTSPLHGKSLFALDWIISKCILNIAVKSLSINDICYNITSNTVALCWQRILLTFSSQTITHYYYKKQIPKRSHFENSRFKLWIKGHKLNSDISALFQSFNVLHKVIGWSWFLLL